MDQVPTQGDPATGGRILDRIEGSFDFGFCRSLAEFPSINLLASLQKHPVKAYCAQCSQLVAKIWTEKCLKKCRMISFSHQLSDNLSLIS